jgi:hypothetical protein
MRSLETLYGLGRLIFGVGVMAAPEGLGGVLIGRQIREPAVRTSFRFYGTRDAVLGLGTLRAASGGGDVGAWVAAGIASDVLDVAVQLIEWADLEPDKRLPGVLAAAGAAGVGMALLARR